MLCSVGVGVAVVLVAPRWGWHLVASVVVIQATKDSPRISWGRWTTANMPAFVEITAKLDFDLQQNMSLGLRFVRPNLFFTHHIIWWWCLFWPIEAVLIEQRFCRFFRFLSKLNRKSRKNTKHSNVWKRNRGQNISGKKRKILVWKYKTKCAKHNSGILHKKFLDKNV